MSMKLNRNKKPIKLGAKYRGVPGALLQGRILLCHLKAGRRPRPEGSEGQAVFIEIKGGAMGDDKFPVEGF